MPRVSQFLRVYCKTDTRRSDVKHPKYIHHTMRIIALRVLGWVYCVTEVSRVVSPRQLGQVEALTTTVSCSLKAETLRRRDSNNLYGDGVTFVTTSGNT